MPDATLITKVADRPSSALEPMVRELVEGCRRLRIGHEARLVLAISGGPDSMALLHGTAQAAAERGWQLVVAHLDHALRPDSAADAAFVTQTAESLGLPWRVRRADVAALATTAGQGLEAAGRAARYAFLDEVAAEMGRETMVVTAHTADDQAETILLNLVRGSGQRGLRGMPARRGRVVRPLLHVRRDALRSALHAAGLTYRLDPTNADVTRARARVRAEILPALEGLNPAVATALLRYAALAADDDAFLDELARAELARRRAPDGSLDWHAPPPPALGRRMLRLAVGDPAPAAERIEAVLEAARGPRGGLVIELGRGRMARIRGRRIGISQ